jgi:hypothetical protein
MPDFKKDLAKALNGLDQQVIDMVGDFITRRKKHYEQAAAKLHTELKADVERYGLMLLEGNITKDEFEMLVNSRTGLLKIQILEEMAVSKAKFEEIALEVAKLAIKAVFLLL